MFRRKTCVALVACVFALAGPLNAGAPLQQDLTSLEGVWESGPVKDSDGKGTGTLKLQICRQSGDARRARQARNRRQKGWLLEHVQPDVYIQAWQKGGGPPDHCAGPIGTGLVLTYTLEDGKLVLSGPVVSHRVSYELHNVAMRQTSKVAKIDDAAGGKDAKKSTTGIKVSGDVYEFVQSAVQEKRLADVDVKGFTATNLTYRDVAEDGGLLVGFQVGLGKFGNNAIISSLRPVFMTKKGEKFGKWVGPPPASPITVKAKPGYVVGGVLVRSAIWLDGFTCRFVKLGAESLEQSDFYMSQPMGGNGGALAAISGQGALFTGIYGHLSREGNPVSVGLIAVVPKE